MLYSVSHAEVLPIIWACIEQNGVLAFERCVHISVDNFMTLLEFYLCSTFVSYDDKVYIQHKGICTSSHATPALCNIFLSAIVRDLASALDNAKVQKALTYVGYLLMILISNLSGNDH